MAEASASAGTDPRDNSLGYLRAFTVLLVVAHHVATAYAGVVPTPARAFPGTGLDRIWGAFPIVSPDVVPGLSIFLGVNDAFFMSLLFLVSGVYVWRSVERHGAAGFAWRRILRLGAPFLVAALVLAPLAYLPAYLQITGGGDIGSFLGAWYGAAGLSAGPAWFLWVLLAFDLVAAILFMLWRGWAPALGRVLPDGARRPGLFFLVLTVLSLIAYAPMAAAFGSAHWTMIGPFDVQTARIVHYALYFLVGVALGTVAPERSLIATDGRLARGWWAWLFVSLVALVVATFVVIVVSVAKALEAPVREAIGGIAFSLMCASMCFLVLAVFLRFVRRPNPVMNSLRDNSYGVYLVHYVFVNWLDYALLGPDIPAVAKFAIGVAGAAVLSWATSVIARRLLGGRRGSGAARSVQTAAA
jgi:peptidoglycan/LPS O-acetylase OafA/YrhL